MSTQTGKEVGGRGEGRVLELADVIQTQAQGRNDKGEETNPTWKILASLISFSTG